MKTINIYSKNHNIAFEECKKAQVKSVIWVFNRDFNYLTGSFNVLDIFIYDPNIELFQWLYGVESWKDNTVTFPKYTFDFLKEIIEKIFNGFTNIYIGNKEIVFIPYIFLNKINKCLDMDYSCIFQKNIHRLSPYNKKLFFEIIYLKMNMFHNYMDTSSISFYLKDIALKSRLSGLNDIASFFSEKAYKMNKNNVFLEEFLISLNKNMEFKKVIHYEKLINTDKGLKELAYAYKMVGYNKKSLEINDIVYKNTADQCVFKEITYLKGILDEK